MTSKGRKRDQARRADDWAGNAAARQNRSTQGPPESHQTRTPSTGGTSTRSTPTSQAPSPPSSTPSPQQRWYEQLLQQQQQRQEKEALAAEVGAAAEAAKEAARLKFVHDRHAAAVAASDPKSR